MKSKAPGQFLRFRIIIVGSFILLGIAIYIASYIPAPKTPEFIPPTPATSTTIPTVTPTETPIAGTSVPVKPPTPTPPVDSIIFTIKPKMNYVGWVQSDEKENHFGKSYLYTGLYDGTLYHGAIQFDISAIPPGSEIVQAEIELTGLTSDLQESNDFALNILTAENDDRWPFHDFKIIHDANVEEIDPLILKAENLGPDKVNLIEFNPGIQSLIEGHLKTGAISFRLDSLTPEQEGRFAWDSGYGPDTNKKPPVLRLSVRLPNTIATRQARQVLDAGGGQVTPTPVDASRYIIVTSTPTPENILTAVAIQLTATYEFEYIGEPTATPIYWVTPWVLEDMPTPENEATVYINQMIATIEATVFGTPTPLPVNAVTVTPTPTYFILTSTPTPESILTAAAMVSKITADAKQFGPATPLPENWVTPIIVTSTPTPVNQMTAEYIEAVFITTGTPTPMPDNAQTATPTPVYLLLDGELPPLTPTPTPTFTPGPIPSKLIGKIAFKSDRTYQEKIIDTTTGAEKVVFDENDPSQIFVISPDGTGLALLSDRWPYELANQADVYSSDGRFRVFTKDVIRYQNVDQNEIIKVVDAKTGEVHNETVSTVLEVKRIDAPGLYWYDAHYDVEDQLTKFGAGIAYGGVWSPTREEIAFISTESQNDEIWVINRDGTELKQLTVDRYNWWDKHPSWSPDGNQIVFWSNRTGHGQIWVMDRDGSNLYSLSRTGFNDWDPVWIKYPGMSEYEKD